MRLPNPRDTGLGGGWELRLRRVFLHGLPHECSQQEHIHSPKFQVPGLTAPI